jgi:biotin synthase
MNSNIPEIIKKVSFDKNDIMSLLSASTPCEIEIVRKRANEILVRECGPDVYCRGLVEFSNQCINDCFYCGIRKSNSAIQRYFLNKKEIVEAAKFCADAGYGSIVLQSGERRDDHFIDFVEDAVKTIKKETTNKDLPHGLGVTLCVGEQKDDVYERFFEAGAHRYLLRIETTSPDLFARIHPARQTLDSRLKCLAALKRIGYQTGTGVMIGLPGQSMADLADDVLFFRDNDIDMIGMGPYIVHHQTPMARYELEIKNRKSDIFNSALKMIAVVRIVCHDVNIASTTALQAMEPLGREQGLEFGANVIMPQVTPTDVRKNYMLYEGKPCLDENASLCRSCIEQRIKSIGRNIGSNKWGDSRHFKKKHADFST